MSFLARIARRNRSPATATAFNLAPKRHPGSRAAAIAREAGENPEEELQTARRRPVAAAVAPAGMARAAADDEQDLPASGANGAPADDGGELDRAADDGLPETAGAGRDPEDEEPPLSRRMPAADEPAEGEEPPLARQAAGGDENGEEEEAPVQRVAAADDDEGGEEEPPLGRAAASDDEAGEGEEPPLRRAPARVDEAGEEYMPAAGRLAREPLPEPGDEAEAEPTAMRPSPIRPARRIDSEDMEPGPRPELEPPPREEPPLDLRAARRDEGGAAAAFGDPPGAPMAAPGDTALVPQPPVAATADGLANLVEPRDLAADIAAGIEARIPPLGSPESDFAGRAIPAGHEMPRVQIDRLDVVIHEPVSGDGRSRPRAANALRTRYLRRL